MDCGHVDGARLIDWLAELNGGEFLAMRRVIEGQAMRARAGNRARRLICDDFIFLRAAWLENRLGRRRRSQSDGKRNPRAQCTNTEWSEGSPLEERSRASELGEPVESAAL